MSKKIIIANSDIVSDSQTSNRDPFFSLIGNWTVDDGNLKFAKNNDVPIRLYADSVEVVNTARTSSILDAHQLVTLKMEITDPQQEIAILSTVNLDQRYYDYSAEVVLPDSRADVIRQNKDNVIATKPSVNAEYDYIRDNIEYDQVIAGLDNEVTLVNYYEPQISSIPNKSNYVKLAKRAINQPAESRQRYTNIFVPPESTLDVVQANSLLDDTSQYSYEIEDLDYTSEIPFLVKLKLKDTNGDIDQKQDFVKLGNNYLFYADTNDNDPDSDIGSLLMRWHLENSDAFIGQQQFIVSRPEEQASDTPLSCYSFLSWLNDFAPARVGNFPDNIQPIKFSDSMVPSLRLAENNYEDIVSFTSTLSRLATRYFDEFLYSSETKRIEDVLVGTPANTEILYYKIEKYEGNNTVGTPVQTIVIPNTREDIQYFDTQVFYNKEYTYMIKYVVAIHGCEYEYESVIKQDDGTYELKVRSYPSLKVVEMPAFIGLGSVISNPPLVPRLEVYPIRRQENKIKLVFYSNYGNEVEKPISLNPRDNLISGRILRNGFLTSPDSTIEYNNRSSAGSFEIYTSTAEPLESDDYSLFSKNLFATVGTLEDGRPVADSAAIVLELKEDKKYYFTFLARNRLGVASNPTKIYEFMYTKKDGISRIQYQEYIFDGKTSTRKEAKVLTKLINLRPRFAQTLPDFEKSNLVDKSGNPQDSRNKKVFLGTTDDAMFGFPGEGKKFKFRFRSKKTNKIFDINVSCVNTRVVTPFDTNGEENG